MIVEFEEHIVYVLRSRLPGLPSKEFVDKAEAELELQKIGRSYAIFEENSFQMHDRLGGYGADKNGEEKSR